LSKILIDLCIAFGDAHPPPPKISGRTKIPGGDDTQTPFLFTYPLGLRPEKIFGEQQKEKI